MSLVVTLISSPDDPQVSEEAISRARQALLGSRSPVVLDPGIAVDVALPDCAELPTAIHRIVAGALEGMPIDIVVQPTEARRKKLLLADMDKTLIGQECINELADLAGCGNQVAAVTDQAMRGELDFDDALRDRVKYLAHAEAGLIDRVINERITTHPGAEYLAPTMRRSGAYCAIVSGGFVQFTGYVAATLGFDEHQSNELQVAGGRLTGAVIHPILGKDSKRKRLHDLIAEHDLPIEASLVVGDGANDLDMITAAGLGVAYHAQPVVSAAAGAAINHGDLTALLYLQGYRRDEFALQ